MSHFYDEDGKLHECDIKEARANGWKAGTTEIIHEFDNSYGLQLYKARQMFFASLTLPRPKGVNDEEYFELVKKDSEEHSERAKEFGVEVHAEITRNLKYNATLTPFNEAGIKVLSESNKVIQWIKSNQDSVIVDFKTQETKNGKFKQPYDSWLWQLCGYKMKDWDAGEYIDYGFSTGLYGGTTDYAMILHDEPPKLINIMISSNEDIPIKIYPWKQEKIIWGCKVFPQMVELYNTIKKL